MADKNTDLFYSRLPVNEIPLRELLSEDHLFYRIPDDWHVIITDVKKSTSALERGLHETVNLIATGSIVAVLNIAYRSNVTIPFFFGGDGATFIVPPSLLIPSLKALLIHRENSLRNYELDLRVGQVAVADIYKENHELRIGKLKTSQLFTIPVLLGDGLSFAEKKIKGEDALLPTSAGRNEELDLTGMQCRWDKIKPPQEYDEVVSLLVIASDPANQAAAFKQVIDTLDNIYGEADLRTPISVPMLKLKGTLEKIGQEMRVKFGRLKPLYLLYKWATTLAGSYYFRTQKGKQYLLQLVELSDTLVIDGKINTVISGTGRQREALEKSLQALEASGEIQYGLFVSKESVMSCYVRNMNENHIHFVDGSEGGYTRAAVMLKRKFTRPQL